MKTPLVKTNITALLLAAFCLIACATTPLEPRLYSLANYAFEPPPIINATAVGTVLVVDQIRVADFLERSGIVYMTAPNRVSVARRHRWADPLPTQLRRNIHTRLTERLHGVTVFSTSNGAPPAALSLAIQFNTFNGRFDGMALIAGTWRLHGSDGAVVAQSSFNQAVPLVTDGYDALVAALSKGLDSVTDGVADAVGKLQ